MILSALLNKLVGRLRGWVTSPWAERLDRRVALARYHRGGRIPWSRGYEEYRAAWIAGALADADVMRPLLSGGALPGGWGQGLDERCVELPWAVGRLRELRGRVAVGVPAREVATDPSSAVVAAAPVAAGNRAPDGAASGGRGLRVLDAGSALNQQWLLDEPVWSDEGGALLVCTLAPEAPQRPRAAVSYLYADLRDLPVREGWADAAACVSTLEHIGQDNTRHYGADGRFAENRPDAWRPAVEELRRVLRPGGEFLLTVPFGRAERLGWMQVFDEAGLDAVTEAFTAGGRAGRVEERTFFRHTPAGWVRAAMATECADCRYFDVHAEKGPAADGAAAARAVACVRMVKGEG